MWFILQNFPSLEGNLSNLELPQNISQIKLVPTCEGVGVGVPGPASSYSPHVWPQVNLSAPVVNTSCWDQPTLVPAASHKVDLFNGQLTGVLLTSLFVTAMGDVTVAHLGTAEGRIFQVGWWVGWDGRSWQAVGYAQPPALPCCRWCSSAPAPTF